MVKDRLYDLIVPSPLLDRAQPTFNKPDVRPYSSIPFSYISLQEKSLSNGDQS